MRSGLLRVAIRWSDSKQVWFALKESAERAMVGAVEV
jgi:hypothetical protein